MPDGTIAAIDNTRVLAVRQARIEIRANVRAFNDPITDALRQRTLKVNGAIPSTRGKAVLLHITKLVQNMIFPVWSQRFPYGSIYDPRIKQGVMMSKQFHVYADAQLPSGFKYPPRLLEMAATGEYPDIYPWWFVDASSKAGELFYSTRQSDGRNLIPFAKVDDDRDDIACFDGDDRTGNPAVLMLVPEDSGRCYTYIDFDDWLRAARADAEHWRV